MTTLIVAKSPTILSMVWTVFKFTFTTVIIMI